VTDSDRLRVGQRFLEFGGEFVEAHVGLLLVRYGHILGPHAANQGKACATIALLASTTRPLPLCNVILRLRF